MDDEPEQDGDGRDPQHPRQRLHLPEQGLHVPPVDAASDLPHHRHPFAVAGTLPVQIHLDLPPVHQEEPAVEGRHVDPVVFFEVQGPAPAPAPQGWTHRVRQPADPSGQPRHPLLPRKDPLPQEEFGPIIESGQSGRVELNLQPPGPDLTTGPRRACPQTWPRKGGMERGGAGRPSWPQVRGANTGNSRGPAADPTGKTRSPTTKGGKTAWLDLTVVPWATPRCCWWWPWWRRPAETSQTAQAPSPSPSPSPPAGTVTVHGKVYVLDELSFFSCFLNDFNLAGCVGSPVRDGTEVAAYDDAAIPASASLASRLQQALARLERLPKKNPKTLERLRKALAKAQRAKPAKVPGSATPVATARTSNGNYTLNVPASFIGKNLLVCVTGQPATPNPNPGNPDIIGFCTTLTVQANTGGNTMVNQVSFIAPELSGNDNFLIDVRSATTGQSVIGGVIGQKEALDIVFARPVTAGLKAALDSPTTPASPTARTSDPCFFFEADFPFDATYAGYGGTATGPDTAAPRFIRVVTSLPAPNVYRFQGAVQWRSERTQDTPYTLFEFCGPDVLFMEPGLILVVTPSANVGQFVVPFVEEVDEIPLAVRQDTELPRFATGGLGLPAAPAPGWGNVDESDALAENDRVHIPFSEPIIDASSAPSVTGLLSSGLANSRWTVFIPASDTSNWNKPTGANALFDAHQNTWLSTGFQEDDGGVATTVVAARLADLDNTGGATDPELAAGNSVLTRFSAGVSDPWAVGGDPTFIVDKGGNQVTAGGGNDALLTFGGVVVP